MFSIRMLDHIAATSVLVMDVDDKYLDDKWCVGDRFFCRFVKKNVYYRLPLISENVTSIEFSSSQL